MKNIHILSTENYKEDYKLQNSDAVIQVVKLGQLIFDSSLKEFRINKNPSWAASCDTDVLIPHNIYITNDEEIKRYGEYYLDIDTKEIKTSFENMGKYLSNEKKIVLTDNEDLIKDGVQAIDDEFLEWFVKNPSCESVEVDWVDFSQSYFIKIPKEDWLVNNPQCKQIESCSKSLSKKCICPKEEQTKCYCGHTNYCDCGPNEVPDEERERGITITHVAKQETLLEIANKKLMSNDWLNGAEFGAKWQQEQDIPKQGIPTEVDSILAKITHQNDLGLSQWYEVVYYDNKWCSYSGSKTFEDGERVVGWKYCKDLI